MVEGGVLGRTKSKVRIDSFTEKVFLWGGGGEDCDSPSGLKK